MYDFIFEQKEEKNENIHSGKLMSSRSVGGRSVGDVIVGVDAVIWNL